LAGWSKTEFYPVASENYLYAKKKGVFGAMATVTNGTSDGAKHMNANEMLFCRIRLLANFCTKKSAFKQEMIGLKQRVDIRLD